jgi:pimeloyl-ACP methyl ester carboxylesterase
MPAWSWKAKGDSWVYANYFQNFLDTPDGRPGWSSFFLSQGYIVYLSDQTNRGRSPWQPSIGSMITFDVPAVENYFTDPSEQKLWPQAHLHNQWPGTGRVGDPYFDAVFASQIQFQLDFVVSDRTNQKAYSALLDKIGASYLITHSQAGTYGWLVGDARPDLVKGIVALEPSGPPFQNEPPFGGGLARPWGVTVTEIQYEPSAGPNATHLSTIVLPPVDSEHTQCIMQAEPAKKLKNLANIPVLIVSGEASFHAPYGQCTVNYLKQAGVDVDYADLGEQGIHGNGHFFFMEKNNLVIAKRVLRWLKDH